MNHEQPQADPNPDANPPSKQPWQPDEQVRDIYDVDVPDDGSPVTAELIRDEPPRIWVGSWFDYNNGVLHGQWIDADRDDDAIWIDIQTMLKASPTAAKYGDAAEDWGIFDHDNFGPLRIGEQETVEWVGAVARGISEHGPAFAAWADVVEERDRLDDFTDAYLGDYDSLDAYAEQLIDDLGYTQLLDDTLPESIRRYVDFNTAGLAQDLWLSGDVHIYHKDGGGVWLFDGRQ